MRFYLGVTDTNWFRRLRALAPEDINFWQPSGRRLTGLKRTEPFLFKLKAPYNAIGGVGFFSAFAAFPLSIAWDAFGERNGCATKDELLSRIKRYREKNHVPDDPTMTIGCIILSDPLFFEDDEMVSLPPDWDDHTVTGKFYDFSEGIGAKTWSAIQDRLIARKFLERPAAAPEIAASILEPAWREVATKVRVGQGAFRFMVTEAYGRACAVTGDHTLPVLEAAHIRPYAESGPHAVFNGLLLRSDLHKLFDDGYLTIAPDYRVEVSRALREEFKNGRIYYDLHGSRLKSLPASTSDYPSREFLEWHNTKVFKAS
jgi:putative restriction endonuclease